MKPLMLVILDGFGLRKEKRGNAVAKAKTPNFNFYWKNYPHCKLKASGEAVGLPKGTLGGSEVGHLNIGAGRIVYQELTRINKAIKNGSFFKNKALLGAINHVKKNNSSLHLIGLLSDAGVHSDYRHLFALLKLAKKNKVNNVYIHVLTDGRDTAPRSALKYIKELKKQIKKLKIGKIATVIGRYYAMDRDKRWNRTEKAYNCIVLAKGLRAKTAEQAVKNSYEKNVTDEFILPTVIGNFKGIKDKDSVILWNYRADRARQISYAFVNKEFDEFKRKKVNINYTCMCEYDEKLKVPVAFPPLKLKNILGEVLSRKGLHQLRIAETEKYAHVTFFFNGGKERPFKKEDRILIPSPKVATYDKTPEMSAYKITEELISQINLRWYDFILVNYANPDMVGHTGDFKATVKAVEVVDECLGKIVKAMQAHNGIIIITADHGNAEDMKRYRTSHTLNPVPFIILEKGLKLRNGILADIAPTILQLMNIKKPKEMKGRSLIKK